MLKTGTPEQISTMYKRLGGDVKNLITGIVQLAYFMRGGMTYNQILFTMSYIERELAMDYISNRLETEMKSPHPNY